MIIETKRKIMDTTKTIMSNEPFDKITVTYICQEASVNRQTFYHHFLDKYDLIKRIFEEDIVKALDHYLLQKKYHEGLDLLLKVIYENQPFYKQAFLIEGECSYETLLQGYLESVFCRIISIEKIEPNPALNNETIAKILSLSFALLMKEWAINENHTSLEQVEKALLYIEKKSLFAQVIE